MITILPFNFSFSPSGLAIPGEGLTLAIGILTATRIEVYSTLGYPQSGQRVLGRSNLQALRSHHPGKPAGFNVKRILGNGDLWITEYTITYQGR
jgi:hypothetical protein